MIADPALPHVVSEALAMRPGIWSVRNYFLINQKVCQVELEVGAVERQGRPCAESSVGAAAGWQREAQSSPDGLRAQATALRRAQKTAHKTAAWVRAASVRGR